jgi:hypothetical protein
VSGLDLYKLDRDIARAARAERAWWRMVRADANRAADDPWFEPVRYVTTRATFQEVASLPENDPLRLRRLAFVHRLAVTRIARTHIVELAKARQDATLRLEKPESGVFSVRALVRRVVADTEPARARAWLEALGAEPSPLFDHEKVLREATQEISARLGNVDADWLAPFDRAAVLAEGEHFLRRTDDLASSLFSSAGDLAALVAKLVARDVPGVWPTRPDARWLFDQFQGSPLLQGLAIDIGPAPSALGAASYARALARLGAAYARVAVLGGAPFVATSDPDEVHPYRRGALLASLAAEPLFLRKQLGLSRDAAGAASRALAATFLATLRLSAIGATIDIARVSRAALAESVENALKVPAPPELSGAFPRHCPRSAERLAASLFAQRDLAELRDGFDDDWFRNPRGLLFLREADAASRPDKLASETFRGQGEALARALETLSG